MEEAMKQMESSVFDLLRMREDLEKSMMPGHVYVVDSMTDHSLLQQMKDADIQFDTVSSLRGRTMHTAMLDECSCSGDDVFTHSTSLKAQAKIDLENCAYWPHANTYGNIARNVAYDPKDIEQPRNVSHKEKAKRRAAGKRAKAARKKNR